MKRLYRTTENKLIGGICSGIAEAYNLDTNVVRLVFVFVGLATGGIPLLAAYVVGWIIIPARSDTA